MNIKTLFLTIVSVLMAFGAKAQATLDEIDRCNTVEIYGPGSGDVIKITAFSGSSSATKGMAFFTLPGKKDYTAKGVKYLDTGLEEGCFGVLDSFYFGGRNYSNVSIIVGFEAEIGVGVTVEYSISKDDTTLVNGSFPLKSVKYSNPIGNSAKDKAGYVDADWTKAFVSFMHWMMGHLEEYKD